MTDKMKSFVKGILLGLCGHSLPQGEKEPVAYLYGHVAREGETPTHTIDGVEYVGAVLPKLPEWDKSVYPYAYITVCDGADLSEELAGEKLYVIHMTTKPLTLGYGGSPVWVNSGTTTVYLNYTPSQLYREYVYSQYGIALLADEWSHMVGPDTVTVSTQFSGEALWANSDMCDSDGTVYIAASDPIPIYE